MYANLHFHSKYSDGSDTPGDLVKKAKESGLELISLTDHNTCLGYNEFIEACDFYKMPYVCGVELDAKQPELKYCKELLAYFPNGKPAFLNEILINKQQERKERVLRALNRLMTHFQASELLYSDLEELAYQDRGFEAPMISNKLTYRYLVKKNIGISPNFEEIQPSAFWKSIWSMKDIDPKYDLFKLCRIIKENNGFSVMPHFAYHCKRDPQLMINNSSLYINRLKQMKENGLWGIEIHPYRMDKQRNAINSIITTWAEKLDMPLTYGTDYHGNVGNTFIKSLGQVPFATKELLGDFKGFIR